LEKNVGWQKKSALSKNPKNDDPISPPRRPHRVDYGAARQVLVQVQRWRRDALVADADVRERRLPSRCTAACGSDWTSACSSGFECSSYDTTLSAVTCVVSNGGEREKKKFQRPFLFIFFVHFFFARSQVACK